MPRLNGTKLMEVLKEWKNLQGRFIVMSGMPNIEHVRGLPNVRAVLRKPFLMTTLDAMLTATA
jgi:YesN/AraC family two-component response regulator